MHSTPAPTHDEAGLGSPYRPRGQRRLILLFCLLLAILLLNFIPPLLNLSRFQRRIAGNIGAALGRPVHFDRVSLNLLPLPGVTLQNFVVDEDPAFGAEPIIRAGTVHATVRFSSLWRRRVEFSNISLHEGPNGEAISVNLVHTPDGRWNFQGLLLQAARIQAAPTAQTYAGPAPRFPYIEATGARLNLKLGQEKTPFSLTDADFALWLPEPHQWHLRLEAHPIRTDTNPTDTGTVRVEGTVGGPDAAPASLSQLPIALRAQWQEAQLGALSHLFLRRDAGLRGELTVTADIFGTIGHNAIAAIVKLNDVRRAAFVPPSPLSLEAGCQAIAQANFHSFSSIACSWPPAGSSAAPVLTLAGAVPDVRHPRSAYATLTVPALPTATVLEWLSLVTVRPPHGVLPVGTVTGSLSYHPMPASPDPIPTTAELANPRLRRQPLLPQPTWSGDFTLTGGSLKIDALGAKPIELADVTLRSTPLRSTPPPAHLAERSSSANPPPATLPSSFDLLPITLPLGGRQPATIEGHFDASGYTLRLTGTVVFSQALALGNAIPQFGDGLEAIASQIADSTAEPCPRGVSGCGPTEILSSHPLHVDLTATRLWFSSQTWRPTAPPPTHHIAPH